MAMSKTQEFINSQDSKTILRIVAGVVIVSIGGYVFYYYVNRCRNDKLIKKKIDELNRKTNILKDRVSKTDLLLPISQNVELTELTSKIASKVYKPIEILHFYQKNALEANAKLNFIIDINEYAELQLTESEQSKRPNLRGIPVSIKDYFYVKNCDSTFGLPSFVCQPSQSDSVLVQVLKLNGAIPFFVTNMSQTGFSIESSNPVIGETKNPYCLERTAGGSSGGEGAIIASNASIIGLGSDIGGSIRIPAHYCGIYGFKPTSRRLSHSNIRNLFTTQNFIRVSNGPMARNINDLIFFFKTLACSDLYNIDPTNPPLCFNDRLFEKKRPLKIGVYIRLAKDEVIPIPAVERAINEAKTALNKAGHTTVEFRIPDVKYAMNELYYRCLFTDGGTSFLNEAIGTNTVDPTIKLMVHILSWPNWLKIFMSYLIYPFNRPYSYGIYNVAGVGSITNVWKLNDAIEEYRMKVIKEWQDENLDALICPVLPIVAPLLKTTDKMLDILSYTAIFNLLDFPAGVVPITKVTQNDIRKLKDTYPRDNATHRFIYQTQADGTEGLPVGVQCVSMMWREEICLRTMKEIATNLQRD